MKKIIYLLFSVLCLIAMFGLVACNDKNSSDNGPETKDNTVYKVTCENSDYYTFGGTVSATSGTAATINLTSKYPAYQITGCTFNGNECERTSAEDAETQEFSFNMPASDVEIKVLYTWSDTSTSGYNNFLFFDGANDYNTTSASGDSSYNNDEYWGEPLILKYTTNASYMTSANISCFSTNENVIPSDAIVTKDNLSSTSNVIIGGRIIIDRSKINVGTTQIVLRVASNNSNSYDAIIVATITVG